MFALLLLTFALLVAGCLMAGCSTANTSDAQGDLSKQGPCAASWNLRYEELVGHNCYPKRVVQAAKAGCKAGDKTSCKVARAVGRVNRTRHLDLDESAISTAAAAGCKAGVGDGCAVQGLELLKREATAKAAQIFQRGCKLGSRASCYEAARLGGNAEAGQPGEASSRCDAKEPVPCRRNACRRGDGVSCRMLGHFAETGEHLERDHGAAVEYYERACMLGDMPGCGELGRFYAHGRVVPRQSTVARRLFTWGCSPESTEACVGAARMLSRGLGGARDPKAAQKLYASACDQKNSAACRELAGLYQTSSELKASNADIDSLYDKGCDLGDGLACAQRATTELQRKPLSDEDVEKIISLYHKTCDAGFLDGCREGANRFLRGDGVPADATVAAMLGAKACDAGSAGHCWGAADAFRFGYGVEVDQKRATALITKAITHYKKECEAEDSPACSNAAHAIGHGYPEGKRLEEAQKFLEKACEDGAKSACREIAAQYVVGELYPRDRQRGVQKLRSMCNDGDQESCKRMADELSFGLGGDNELADALDHHRRACFWYRDFEACVQLSMHYQRGHGTKRDVSRAYDFGLRGCDEESEEQIGCKSAALAIMRQKPPEDAEKTMPEVLQQFCVYDGQDSVCTPLARMHETGYQLPKEPYRAISLYERVCDGNADFTSDACSRAELARLSLKVTEDAKAAGRKAEDAKQEPGQLEKACNRGNATSCVLLARHYEFGSFDGDRFRKAIPFYRKACKLGNQDACTLYVNLIYEEGQPWGDKFYGELGWACERGTAQMCYEWGNYMGNHKWELAVKMNQSACAKGNEGACGFLQSNLEPLPKGVEDAAGSKDQSAAK